MNKKNLLTVNIAALAATICFSAMPLHDARAQGAPQTLLLADVNVDVQKLATGHRASKIIGSAIYNDTDDKVGKIDDIITSADEKDSFMVLSVGGFLGIGSKLVVVPYQNVKITGDKLILSGATKEALKSLPEFHYSK